MFWLKERADSEPRDGAIAASDGGRAVQQRQWQQRQRSGQRAPRSHRSADSSTGELFIRQVKMDVVEPVRIVDNNNNIFWGVKSVSFTSIFSIAESPTLGVVDGASVTIFF